jgi:uncharacterized protein (DUF885 family)
MKAFLPLALAALLYTPAAWAGPKEDLASMRASFKSDWLKFHPETAFYLGLHSKDIAPPDISTAAMAGRAAYFSGLLRELPPLEAASSQFTPEERIDLALMRSAAEYQEHYLTAWKGQLRDLQDNGNGLVPAAAAQEKASRIIPATAHRDWAELAPYLAGIPAYLAQHTANLRAGLALYHPDRRAAEHEADDARSAADYFGVKLPAQAGEGLNGQPALLASVNTAAAAASEAYLAYSSFVVTEMLPVSGENFPLGTDEYVFRLRTMGIEGTPEELSAKGLALAAGIRADMEKLAARVAPGKPLPEVLRAMAADHPSDENEMLSEYSDAVGTALDFVSADRLYSVPPGFSLPVQATPPSMRGTIPGAAYFPAPPLDPASGGVFLVTPPFSMADRSRADILNTAVHEAMPGHGLEYYYFQRRPAGASTLPFFLDDSIGNDGFYASALNTEGWALHAERLMLERGFYSAAPQARLAAMRALLLRAYRLPLDAGLHTGRLSYEDAVKELADNVFISTPAAQAEVFRYCAIPAQAVTYMVGSMQIEALKDAYRAAAGDAYKETSFYSDLAAYGPVPPAILGPALLGSVKDRK